MCEDKQQVIRTKLKFWIVVKMFGIDFILREMFGLQLILSLEKRLMELSETLENVRDGFLEKSADLEALQKKSDDQVK